MTLAAVALLVREYDEAIRFFTAALRFELVEDTPMGDKRWVIVRPRATAGAEGAALLLARAATPEQQAAIGRQWAGRVGLFLHSADFAADHAHMQAAGVRFLEAPRHEPYGTVAVFEDLYGNRWDLLQARDA
ncbi:VOC family protein [Aquincola sp. S2]|uniref:VOC family protein n=1 Tax=Pseudaquabacterium terrae TaxID=2732868 RepID=A0ABX2EMP5_9BURK|nr:VOC family protein [Aquabacterium terrae]NRF69835.1 VOC family protein [Aquabacterium terrae]